MGLTENVINNIKSQYAKSVAYGQEGNVTVHYLTDYATKKGANSIVVENKWEAIEEALKPLVKKHGKWFFVEGFEPDRGFEIGIVEHLLQHGKRHSSGVDTVWYEAIKIKETKERSFIWRGYPETNFEGELFSQVQEHRQWKPLKINPKAPEELLEILYVELIKAESLRVKLPDEVVAKYK